MLEDISDSATIGCIGYKITIQSLAWII